MNWNSKNSCYYHLHTKSNNNTNIAMFDMDGCLTKLYSSDPLDGVIEKLTCLSMTHRIVIFSNQYGVSKGKVTNPEVQSRFESFLSFFPQIDVFYSTDKDYYRKPLTGMFDLFLSLIDVRPKSVFYVGDAAGRKGDFSDSDRLFAHNIKVLNPDIKVKFYTEKYFCSTAEKKCTSEKPCSTVKKYIDKTSIKDSITKELSLEPEDNWEVDVFMMVGPQGSGKTTYAEQLCELGYEWINQDHLKTKKKVLKKICQCIKEGKKMVIDRTNTDEKSRKEWLSLFEEKELISVCIYVNIPKPISFFMTSLRVQKNKSGKLMPAIAIHIYYKRHQKPSTEEGFLAIVEKGLPNLPKNNYLKCLF
jgi:bifunctional polynucleotide phosphatase/kinase